jgi:hypothetical protein
LKGILIMRRPSFLATLAAIPLSLSLAHASACSIDGVPTISVNGYTAIINKTPPIGKDLAIWAPFVLSFPLHTGRTETLAEIAQAVPLAPEAFKTPWRWHFGDGAAIARGTSVHHTYSRPGTYKITVEAYFPSHKFWYTFDALQVRVLHS